MPTPYETIKSAILGNPLNANQQPSRTQVVQAFQELQKINDVLMQGITAEYIRSTYALLSLVPATNGLVGAVTNDNDPTLNGIYNANGIQWILVAPLPVTAAETYADDAAASATSASASATSASASALTAQEIASGISVLVASAPFSGTFNGSSAVITLPVSATGSSQVLLFVGGIYQDPTIYSVSNTTLTLPETLPNGVDFGGFVMASVAIQTLPLSTRATLVQMLAGSDDGIWASALKVFQFYQTIGDRWWLGLAQSATANDASLAAATAARGTSLFIADKQIIPITNRALLAPGVFDARSPAILSILGSSVPMGDIMDNITINVGGSNAFQNPDDVRKYLHDRRIRQNAFVTVQVADGNYTMPNEFYCSSPDMTRVRFIGNIGTMTNCTWAFDATSNKSGLKADGCVLRVQGVQVIGNGAIGPTRVDWNTDCYGAAALASGTGSRIELENAVKLTNFYYAGLADNLGQVDASNCATLRSGDVAFHARQGGLVNLFDTSITTAAHHDPYGAILGFGINAEQGKASATRCTITDCEVAGLAAQQGGNITAFGTNSYSNVGLGARVLSNGTLNLSTDVGTNTPSYLTHNGDNGAFVGEGGVLYFNGVAGQLNICEHNAFSGIACTHNGEAHTSYAAIGYNGINGLNATGLNAQIYADNITWSGTNVGGNEASSGGGTIVGP